MKNKFIFLLSILITIVISAVFFKINAQRPLYVTTNEKAAIRYKTESSLQGLKFTAKLDESVKDNRHGFFLVYGKTTVDDLRTAVNNSRGKNFFINEKLVYKKEVPGVTLENFFSIVLTGIPSSGYIDKISVISFVEVDGVLRYSANVTVKSVAEVAFKCLNNGMRNNSLDEIVNNIDHKIVFKKNVLNEMEFNNTFYESNHQHLKREFNEDYKDFFNKDFLDLLTLDDDLISFYKDEHLNNKWSFLLAYFKSLSTNDTLKEQITNIQKNSKNESVKELIYAHTNFFNEENNKIANEIIDFTNLNNYLTLKDYNDKIFINIDDYQLYQVGQEFILPKVDKVEKGYVFKHYLISGEKYQPLEKHVLTNRAVILEEVYDFIKYDVNFLDKDNNIISSLNVLHNDFISDFPEILKEGFVLTGWEDENNEIINSATKITSQMTLKPIFKKAIKKINITVEKFVGGVVLASDNITYKHVNYDHNLHFLYLRPNEGYAFAKDIVITVTFTDSTPVKQEILKVEIDYIEFAYDDPHWSDPLWLFLRIKL